ncbi:C2 family cysteine protease [Parafrankia sp. FMc2]|uniref:C2 family cysteine protease n=1 Tax=Parafrankia sp. FMc2 TaxID=3233196 RepID=UPI0034D5767A
MRHPRLGAGHDEPASPRATAVALRQAAEQILLLLGPVIALDDDLTWRSPWQQRCHARIDAWASALAAGARLARERADVLDLAATADLAAVPVPPVPPVRLVLRPPERFWPTGSAWPVDVRFSAQRLAELARRLRAAGHEAVRLLARLGPSGRAVGVCHGLDLVAAQAGEMAESIDRRLAEIAAAEGLARRPAPSPDQASPPADRPAPRPVARGSAAPEGPVAGLAMLIGTDPLRLGVAELAEIAVRLTRLAPGELTPVIGGLRGRPLEVLAAAAALAPSRLDLSTLHRLPAVVALGDLILRQAPPPMVSEVARLFPGLEPPVVEQGPSWSRALGLSASTEGFVRRGHSRSPVWVRGATAADVGQGRLGDCYFLAALLGVVHADPALLRGNLRENANGTVTVTLYTGRGAVEITVTRSLPVDRRTGQEIGADTDNADGDPELWPALYEKAYARLAGSYAGIEGGDPAAAMRQLTGAEAVGVPSANVEVPDIAGRLAAGDVVTVVTRNRTGGGSGLVPAHAYTILGADEHTGRVLLRNPWDQTASDDRLDWRSWEEIRAELAGVQCGSTRRRS